MMTLNKEEAEKKALRVAFNVDEELNSDIKDRLEREKLEVFEEE